jgi:hypothetical protein
VTGGNYFNTIIAGNAAPNGPDGFTTINSSGFNLIQNTNGITFAGTTAQCIFGQNPLLGPLKENGSYDTEFTPPNMMPLPGSPVIDKGANYYDSDQRRYHRPFDTDIPNAAAGADIGAIEVQPSTLVVLNTNNSGPGSLRQALSDNYGLGGGNIILFSNTVAGTITLSGAELTINAPVSIAGPGTNVLAISGNNSVRVFTVLKGPAQITDLTICNGLAVGSPGPQGQNGFEGRGGGIYTQDTLSLGNCVIRSNRVVGGLGGERHLGVVGKGGQGMGAGIYNANADLTLEFCSVEGNNASGGQGGSATSGAAGDGGNGLGGGVSTAGARVTIISCSFANNVAQGGPTGSGGTPTIGGQGYGAGLYLESPTMAVYSTFSGCNAVGGTGGSGYGGAIYSLNTLGMSLCTVASNSASGSSFDFGGGIYNVSSLSVTNVTIAGNQADYGGGLHGNANAASSLFAANTATTFGADVGGTINSYDYNLIQSADGLSLAGATNHVIVGQDALLGPLADNGGFGRTMALRPGSAAIDKGKNFSFASDQRSGPRPFDFGSVANAGGGDGSDIGAFELGMPLLVLARQQTNVTLSWPSCYADFILESTPAVGPNNWTPMTNTPVTKAAQQFFATNYAALGSKFFRLKSR